VSRPVIPIGADHRGFTLKARCIGWLEQNGYAPKDLGAYSEARCDALDYARALAAELHTNAAGFGVLICGSGQAMTMTANRYPHLRAALCGGEAMARTTRQHNDANVLVLGADFTAADEALDILRTFLHTAFLGGRYAERRDALSALRVAPPDAD
jgi:ribose 5-phosphate isomerase B